MAYLTDAIMLNEVQYDLIEEPDSGATFPSGLWTPAEVLGQLNDAQRMYVKATRIMVGRSNFDSVAGAFDPGFDDGFGSQSLAERVNIAGIPGLEDVVQIIRVAYVTADGVFHEVPATDLFGADHGRPTWAGETVAVPLGYSATDGRTTELIFIPPPTAVGTVWLHFIPRLPTLDLSFGGQPMAMPSEFTLGVKWKLLAMLLGKPGRAQDVERAKLCDDRYNDMVTLGMEMVEGLI